MLVPVLTFWFIHIQICAWWENSYCGFNLSIFTFSMFKVDIAVTYCVLTPRRIQCIHQQGHVKLFWVFLAWRRTVWLKTTAVLFSHPVRQSNIIFEELHNKSFQVLLWYSIYINTPCLISYICKWLNVPASVSASVGMRAGGLGSGSEEYLIEETTVSRKTGGASGLFESVSGSGTGSRGRSSSKDGMRRTQDSPLFVERKSKTTHSRRYDG